MAIRTYHGAVDTNWGTAANWVEGAVPVDGDDVIIADGSITAGLDQSAVTLASLRVLMSFTGNIGIYDITGSTYLQVGASKADLGVSTYGGTEGAGPPLALIDFGSSACNCVVHNAAASATQTSLQPWRLLFDSSSAVLHVRKGRVGVATDHAGETSTLGSATSSYVGNSTSDSNLILGIGVTITDASANAGKITLQSAITKATTTKGEITKSGVGTLTSANCFGGIMSIGGRGSVGEVNLRGGTCVLTANSATGPITIDGGILDTTRSDVARTAQRVDISAGTIIMDESVLSITSAIMIQVERATQLVSVGT